jgi:hypothetical protein
MRPRGGRGGAADGKGTRLRVVCALSALLLGAASFVLAPYAAGAEPPAIVTLVEGSASLLRGTSRYALAEGVRLQAGDIVEVADAGLAQLEFGDGLALSLGSGSRFYAAVLAPRGAKGGAISDFHFMRGWVKFAGGKSTTAYRLTTPVFGVAAGEATAVLHVADAEGEIFVETGELRLAEGFAKAAPTSAVSVKGGELYSRKGEQRGTLQPRPSPGFVSAMPRSFMDNLPPRAAKWKDREVPPRLVGELAYADVEMWLKGPPEIRRVLMRPFIPKARDPAFRAALVANLNAHPEWDRILFPEKYTPKPPPGPAAAPGPAPAGNARTP